MIGAAALIRLDSARFGLDEEWFATATFYADSMDVPKPREHERGRDLRNAH